MKKNYKKTVPMLGLSLVLAGSMLCSQSYAFDIAKTHSPHTYSEWEETTTEENTEATRKCTHSGFYDDRGYLYCYVYQKYIYKSPTVSLTLSKPNDTTTPENRIIYEEGTSLPVGKAASYLCKTNGDLNEDYVIEPGTEYCPMTPTYISSIPSDSQVSHTISIKNSDETTTLVSTTLSSEPNSSSSLSLSGLSGEYKLISSFKDNKPGETVTATETFYVGPYPTIYYNAYLKDGNVTTTDYSNHKDTITIENIKLLSTYKPTELTFYVYEGSNSEKAVFNTTPINDPNNFAPYMVDGVQIGYITEFKNVTFDIGKNINPLNNPYIMVRVIDDRPNTQAGSTLAQNINPNVNKFAKFEKLAIFDTI